MLVVLAASCNGCGGNWLSLLQRMTAAILRLMLVVQAQVDGACHDGLECRLSQLLLVVQAQLNVACLDA